MFDPVFEMTSVRGLDVAGGNEVLQVDTTVTETLNEALTVAASIDVEASMLKASAVTEFLMRPSDNVDVRSLGLWRTTEQTPRSGGGISFIGDSLRNLREAFLGSQ